MKNYFPLFKAFELIIKTDFQVFFSIHVFGILEISTYIKLLKYSTNNFRSSYIWIFN